MLGRVRRTIRERRLLYGGERVLVACSGGPDSMALLDVMARLAPELSLSLGVASVDHGLRPEAADEVTLVGAEAERRGLPFHPLELRVESDGSVQAAARTARYEALRELAGAEAFERIAVGHHRDDQAETVLHRLLRGSGVLGLSGIEPLRDDGVIRPLIDVPRAEIEAHLARFAIPHVHDPSNEDSRHTRARLRADVMPTLLEEDPRVMEHLAALADEAQALRAYLEAEAEAVRLRGAVVPLAGLRGLPPPLRSLVLARWMHDETGITLGREHREEALAVSERGGAQLLPRGFVLTREGETLRLRRSDGRGGRALRSKRARTPRGTHD